MADAAPFQAVVSLNTNAVQVRHSRIIECTLKSNKEFPVQPPDTILGLDAYPLRVTTGFAKALQRSDMSFLGHLILELSEDTSPAPPYFFRVHVEGLFEVVGDHPAADEVSMHRVVASNGAAALFSLAREVIANLTARSLHGMVLLPSVVFRGEPLKWNEHMVVASEPTTSTEK